VLQKGHALRLSIENVNVNVRRQPNDSHFSAAPDFENGSFRVLIDTAFAPRVDLAIGPARASRLPRMRFCRAGQFPSRLELDGESIRAGRAYQVLIGASGNTPGIPGTRRARSRRR